MSYSLPILRKPFLVECVTVFSYSFSNSSTLPLYQWRSSSVPWTCSPLFPQTFWRPRPNSPQKLLCCSTSLKRPRSHGCRIRKVRPLSWYLTRQIFLLRPPNYTLLWPPLRHKISDNVDIVVLPGYLNTYNRI